MKLPNAEEAIVEISKLRDYCLSQSHPRGRHKARVFLAALGITETDADELRTVLLVAAQKEDAAIGVSDQFGTRYVVDFMWKRGSKSAVIRSSWILLSEESRVRFITCFVI